MANTIEDNQVAVLAWERRLFEQLSAAGIYYEEPETITLTLLTRIAATNAAILAELAAIRLKLEEGPAE